MYVMELFFRGCPSAWRPLRHLVRMHEKLSKVECKHFSHWSYLRSCILRLDQGLKSLIRSISYRSFPLCHNKKTTLYALSDLLSD